MRHKLFTIALVAGLIFCLPAQAIILDEEPPKPVAKPKPQGKSRMELENERMKKELQALKRKQQEDEKAEEEANQEATNRLKETEEAGKRPQERSLEIKNATSSTKHNYHGNTFLTENSKKTGVFTTTSGLQYQIIAEGTGASPSATDSVTVHYKGTTIDGIEIDSSYSRGEPSTFPLNRVIAGWIEGLQLMKEGAKYRFFIPSELAYGEQGAGHLVGPNATLIFDIELIKVN